MGPATPMRRRMCRAHRAKPCVRARIALFLRKCTCHLSTGCVSAEKKERNPLPSSCYLELDKREKCVDLMSANKVVNLFQLYLQLCSCTPVSSVPCELAFYKYCSTCAQENGSVKNQDTKKTFKSFFKDTYITP